MLCPTRNRDSTYVGDCVEVSVDPDRPVLEGVQHVEGTVLAGAEAGNKGLKAAVTVAPSIFIDYRNYVHRKK